MKSACSLSRGENRRSPSRREFLTGVAGTVCGLPFLGGCQTMSGVHRGHIDAHVHVWTPDLAAYPLASGYEARNMVPSSFTPEELFAHARPEGITRVVLIQMSFYRFDNRYMTDMIARHRGVFSGVGIIDENAADVRGRMKELARQGVRGFRINPGKQSVAAWLGSPGMAEMWRVAADEDLSICPLINPEALPGIDEMAARYPKTSVVIDHFARIGVGGVIRRENLDQLVRMAARPRVQVKTSAFYALGRKQAPYTDLGPMIRELRDSYGAQRLMWASDCPFQVGGGHSYRESIALIRDRLDFLTRDERDWILRKTAERVFFS